MTGDIEMIMQNSLEKIAGKKVKIQDMIGIRIVAYFQDDVDALKLYFSDGKG